jgi:hypothetical protein
MNIINNFMPYVIAYVIIKGIVLWYMISGCEKNEEPKDEE